jgi:preprotein translocase subunit SecF
MSLRSTLSDVFHERTHYDFVGHKNKWFTLSAVVILIGLAALVLRGLNFGIDFEGGTSWQVKAQGEEVTTAGARDVVEGAGLESPGVQILGGDTIRVEAEESTPEQQLAIRDALATYAGTEPADVSINDVGPTWGEDISDKAVRALIFFFLAIAAYLWLRFEFKMAIAALSAVVHDIFITVSAYAVTGWDVTPATVIAFLTILGFSLYDTVVVFDKVDENVAGMAATGRETYSAVVNRSMNSVLMRSLNTSIVAVLPVLSLLVVGVYVLEADTIKDFALALFVGLITGAYSSVFIATPFLAILKEREHRYAAIRHKLEGRGGGGGAPAYAGAPTAGRAAAGRSLDAPAGEEADGGRPPAPRAGYRPAPFRPGARAAPHPARGRSVASAERSAPPGRYP